VFADEVIGLGQYTPRPKARFTTDDTCRVYLETSGFAMPPVRNQQGEYSVSLTVDIAVKLPQSGRKLVFQPDMATLATTARSKLSSYYMEFAFNFEGWTPRSYALEVGLRDNLGGKTVSQDILLELDEPAEADAKARLEREAATQRGAPGKR
jgi:hypothetical protein